MMETRHVMERDYKRVPQYKEEQIGGKQGLKKERILVAKRTGRFSYFMTF